MNLDIGIVMDGPLSKSISLDRALVAELGRYGISVSVSAYQGEFVPRETPLSWAISPQDSTERHA